MPHTPETITDWTDLPEIGSISQEEQNTECSQPELPML